MNAAIGCLKLGEPSLGEGGRGLHCLGRKRLVGLVGLVRLFRVGQNLGACLGPCMVYAHEWVQ